jgi:uncharacterized membrane protein YidH (DUF202 family)
MSFTRRAGYLHDAGLDQRLDPLRSTLIFGASFIILGMPGLLAAVIQHARVLSRIQRREYTDAAPWPLSATVAIILPVLGAFAFVAILI